jgi:hypothetical protein
LLNFVALFEHLVWVAEAEQPQVARLAAVSAESVLVREWSFPVLAAVAAAVFLRVSAEQQRALAAAERQLVLVLAAAELSA